MKSLEKLYLILHYYRRLVLGVGRLLHAAFQSHVPPLNRFLEPPCSFL